MTSIRNLIWRDLDPYQSTPNLPLDLQGWNADHNVFKDLINEVKPNKILEVGSWKGASALHMAKCLIDQGPSVYHEIICVDTWNGSLEFWQDERKRGFLRNDGLRYTYDIFRNNTKNMQYIITPFPTTSQCAFDFFYRNNVVFDLTYLDASHETHDVERDIRNYFKVSKMLFGDDYDWPSVQKAVDGYAQTHERMIKLEVRDMKWILRLVG